jgi:hypothetical protein
VSHVRRDRAFSAAHAVQEARIKNRVLESWRWLAARQKNEQYPEDQDRVSRILTELAGAGGTQVARAVSDRRVDAV